MSEREHHIKVLKQFLHDYQEWGEDLELEKTIKYAISSLKTDLKYDLLSEGEDVYTKADMVAMLTEMQLEIEEIEIDCPNGFEPVSKTSAFYDGVSASSKVIKQKINSLKGDSNDKID